MSSRKVLIAAALFFAACLLTSASAKVISENTFKELGYSDFAAEEEKCSSYLFSAANLAEGEYFVILNRMDIRYLRGYKLIVQKLNPKEACNIQSYHITIFPLSSNKNYQMY